MKTLQIMLKKLFEMSNNLAERQLSIGKSKKVIGSMKNELSGRIMTEFVRLETKTYSYLIDDDSGDKKGKGTKHV